MIDFEEKTKSMNIAALNELAANPASNAATAKRIFSLVLEMAVGAGEDTWVIDEFYRVLLAAMREAMDISYHNTLTAVVEYMQNECLQNSAMAESAAEDKKS